MKRFSQIQNNWLEIDNSLYKKFEFSDFNSSIDFVNKVSKIANELNHHPTIIINYNIVEIKTTTHDRGDIITDKDFELAQQIENV
jgi:4a-hydroxytetrahydrobiopterin dehydratase